MRSILVVLVLTTLAFSQAYHISYNSNPVPGATVTGYVPVDYTAYSSGNAVTVRGNEGNLAIVFYTFKCWNRAANGTSKSYWPGDTLVLHLSTTVYAVWEQIDNGSPWYTVTYNGNGNTGGIVPVDSSKYFPLPVVYFVAMNPGTLTKTGYTFLDWIDTDAQKRYAVGSQGTVSNSNIVLYAEWLPNPVDTVFYNGNGNTVGTAPPTQTSFTVNGYKDVVVEDVGTLAKEGYTFVGWSESQYGMSMLYFPGDTLQTGTAGGGGNVTLYAQWHVPNLVHTTSINRVVSRSVGVIFGIDGRVHKIADRESITPRDAGLVVTRKKQGE
jgi:uncharacterized repeat protein (TIGR02543 family)